MKRFLIMLASLSVLFGCQKEVYHNVTVTANPAEGGSVSPVSRTVLDGTTVSFKATPSGEYIFTGWSGSISGTENPKTVSVTQDMTVTANFTLRSYPLTITVEGDGTVAEKGISTKSDYQSGTVVELTAKPSEHWLFDHWKGDLNGNTNPVQITVTGSKSVKAVFVEKTYPLNVEIEGEGTVEEKVIQTKSTYQEGTTVELTANPSQGWSFDHWEGDLEGNENPSQITVLSEKNVKAVFVKNKYSFNVKIEGPGVVDEYIVKQTSSFLEYGDQIMLVATPSDDAAFYGWGGDAYGNTPEVIIDIDSDKEISAKFTNKDITRVIQDIDLYSPSWTRKKLYCGVDFSGIAKAAPFMLALDYNLDGYVDVVSCNESSFRDEMQDVEFYLGNEYGFFEPDEINNKKYKAMPPRKTFYGDFNGDNIIDIALISHGLDEDPWPGASPVLLFGSESGEFSYKRFSNIVGYFHGSCAGDFDNDGDLDIFLLSHGLSGEKSWILVI